MSSISAMTEAVQGRASTHVPGGAADRAVSAQRAAQRQERVRLGLDELDLWLADQVRGGLASLQRAGYRPVDTMAARLVDAQAPGLAGLLRALPASLVGEGWPGRALEQLALLRLLVAAHRRLEELPGPLAATVRSRVGYPTAKRAVLETPGVRDEWAVLGALDVTEERLTSRRVWLRGRRTGRWVLLLSFAVGAAGLDTSMEPGTTVEAALHRYPGAGQLRGLVGERFGSATAGVGEVPTTGVADAARAFGRLLAEDPWAERLPVVLEGAPLRPSRPDEPWRFRGEDGAVVPLVPGVEAWPLLARSMGDPVAVVAEWSRSGLRPLAVLPHPLDPVFSCEVLGP